MLCGHAAGCLPNLCDDCHQDLPGLGSGCRYCARVLPQPGICPHCLKQQPAFNTTVGAHRYDGAIRYLVTRAKFHTDLAALRTLGELLARKLLRTTLQQPDALVPVPLHPARLRERGYNQATEVARLLSKRLSVPLLNNRCYRVRMTVPQSELRGIKRRRRNVRDAFALRAGIPVAGSVAIVDDVMTTGMTVNEVARCLKRNGCEHVQVWIVSRTNTYKTIT